MKSSLASAVRGWIVAPSSGQHWDALDGLRGIAILMVVACHGIYANPNGPAFTVALSNFIASGSLGVQMFFVLSGFLIAQPFLKAKVRTPESWYPHGYATRRCLKIFPPYYLVIVLLLIWYLGRYGTTDYLRVAAQWSLGIPHLFYVPAPFFNGSFWSLWVELGFYAVLPLLFWLLRRWNTWSTTLIITATLLILPSIGRCLSTWPRPEEETWYLIYIGGRFPNGLTNFAWGVLFAGWLTVTQTQRKARLATAGYAGALLLMATMALKSWFAARGITSQWSYELVIHLCGFSTFLLLFFVLDPGAIGSRVLSAPVLRFLGLVSYEWFLLHQPMINEFRWLMGSAGGTLPRYLFIVLTPVLVSLVIATLLYHSYSMPIIRRGRDRLARLKKQAEAGRGQTSSAANS